VKTSIRSGERYFGVEVTPDGKLIVAERGEGRRLASTQFPASPEGTAQLRRHIERESAHPHICIKACGAAALSLAAALVPVPGVEVTMVAKHALPASASADDLARLAERLF
jgi:hypothetical protein